MTWADTDKAVVNYWLLMNWWRVRLVKCSFDQMTTYNRTEMLLQVVIMLLHVGYWWSYPVDEHCTFKFVLVYRACAECSEPVRTLCVLERVEPTLTQLLMSFLPYNLTLVLFSVLLHSLLSSFRGTLCAIAAPCLPPPLHLVQSQLKLKKTFCWNCPFFVDL